ncbi:MAG: glutamate decarboxylase, partial [Anaerovoracaceae bacterium]
GLIRNQLLDEGNARLNLATFCQTYMDEDAIKLMSETLEKNAIDKSEYPQTAELERRCVNIIADLWNAPKAEDYVGTSTVGSSEACMLAGMAMKFRWRQAEIAKGRDIVGRKPNLVISTAYQVCWEKFGVYFDVDLRTVPLDEEHLSLNTDVVLDYVDENTIGIVGILGGTYTGHYDDIKALDELVSEYNYTHEHQLVIHIDGASGGMFVPFVQPELLWDFRLKNVVSISTSGHKYGLVYPGVGWIVWRDKEYLPKELVFEVEYLGGSMPTMAINFSRSASQIIGQYYNFLRFGFEGYEAIHKKTQDVGLFISKAIEETGLFTFYNKGEGLPIICYKLKADKEIKWNLYDLADRLRMRGWQVPAYPLSANLEEVIIQRIVCRADFTYNLAEEFVKDFKEAITELKSAHILFHEEKRTAYGFTH